LGNAGCLVEPSAGWQTAGQAELDEVVARSRHAGTGWIEAGVGFKGTAYTFERLIDPACRQLFITGHNFHDVLGDIDTKGPGLAQFLLRLVKTQPEGRVRLRFAPPLLLARMNVYGWADVLRVGIPRLWQLRQHPSLSEGERRRLDIASDSGALGLSAFVRDHDDPERAVIVVTPRWPTDDQGGRRMFFAVWRRDNGELFDALWGPVRSHLDRYDRTLDEVIDDIERLSPGYRDYVEGRKPGWRVPERPT